VNDFRGALAEFRRMRRRFEGQDARPSKANQTRLAKINLSKRRGSPVALELVSPFQRPAEALFLPVLVDDARDNQGEAQQAKEINVGTEFVIGPDAQQSDPFQAHDPKGQREQIEQPFSSQYPEMPKENPGNEKAHDDDRSG
jgi:hypothetical protein